jgi:hypothetical protein
VIVSALVARYGYKSANTETDGLISAFTFATIVGGGLGGHAVAIRIWRRNGWWALAIGLLAAIALIVDVVPAAKRGALRALGPLRRPWCSGTCWCCC